MKNFVFITGLYDTLDLFSRELMAAFRQRGHFCLELSISTMEDDLRKLLLLHQREGVDAVIAFNNLGYNLGENEGGNLWEAMGVPYVDILMDHPFHYHTVLAALPGTSLVGCIDRNHVIYIENYYPNVAGSFFLAHAGCLEPLVTAPHDSTPVRDISVLYAGNLSRVLIEQLIPDFEAYPMIDGAAFSGEVLEDLISNPRRTTEDVIRQHLTDQHISFSPEEEREFIFYFRFLDGFATSFYREQAVRILVEQGIPVDVLGIGWEKCSWADHKNLHLLGHVDAPEVLSYMKRSKVVLNNLTWFKDGAHDRIFNGMLSGAAVVSDTSKYLEEIFASGKELFLYDLKNTAALPGMMSNLLEDEVRRDAMAREGREETLRSHTWKNRAEELLQMLS